MMMTIGVMMSGVLYNIFALSEGYILSGNFSGKTTELFDKDGNIIFTWNHKDPVDSLKTAVNGYSCYLLENGNLLRGCKPANLTNASIGPNAAPPNGAFQEIDLSGNLVWVDTIADLDFVTHHDFKPMPNGNVLAVSFVTMLKAEALNAGLDSMLFTTSGMGMPPASSIQAEKIIEIKPDRTGAGNHEIVWEWYLVDHVTPTAQASSRPERFAGYMQALYFGGQLVHLNGIDFNPAKNLIVFSSRVFSEVYVIDHSTTSEQAMGSTGGTYCKGGDILYRWGHPSNYIIQFKDTMIVTRRGGGKYDTTYQKKKVGHANDYVNCLHCPTWIPEGYRGAGNIMFFHNNDDANMMQLGFSQAVEVNPWDAAGTLNKVTAGAASAPLQPTWVYQPLDSMFSASMSSAIRMKNGNTLIHEAYPGGNSSGKSSTVREVDPTGKLVGTKLTLKQATKYNPAKIMYYPADYPGIAKVLEKVGVIGPERLSGKVLNRVEIVRTAGHIRFSNVAGADIAVYSLRGALVASVHSSAATYGMSTASIPAGTYMVKVRSVDGVTADRVVSIVR